MRIDWAIPCTYTEVNNNLATIIGAGIDHLWVPTTPVPLQVLLAARLVAPAEEVEGGGEHPVTCAVIDSDMNRVAEATGNLQLGGGQVLNPEWLVGFHVPLGVQFMAEREGTYTIEVSVDGHDYRVPMHVIEGPPPGAPPA